MRHILIFLAIVGALCIGKNASSIFAPVWRERCVVAFEAMHFLCVASATHFLFINNFKEGRDNTIINKGVTNIIKKGNNYVL